MAKEIITISGMMEFFKEDINSITKGELKYKADFVLDLRLSDHVIKAKVRASMKDKSYSVMLTVNGDGGISKGECECPRGNWICSHMAASAIYVNKKGMSKTDLPNAWIAKPKKAAKLDSKTFGDFFPTPKPEYRATSRPFLDKDRKFVASRLSEISDAGIECPLGWIAGPEVPKPVLNPLAPSLIEEMLEDFFNNKTLFVEKCKVSPDQVEWLAAQTSGQRKSALWGQFRRLRLTGSNFGDVIKAYERKRATDNPIAPSLLKKLRGEYSLGTKDSIMWGQMYEDVAIKKYKEETGNAVTPIGLVLFSCGFLGSSPDGIIIENGEKGVLEVKCPWSHRNDKIDDFIASELKGKEERSDFYLTSSKKLNQGHGYWHQVQAEMVAVGVSWAHFVVWTTVDMLIVRVERDPEWESRYVPMLKMFYLEELLPTCYTKES